MINHVKKLTATVVVASCMLAPAMPAMADVQIEQNNLFPSFLTSSSASSSSASNDKWKLKSVEIKADKSTINADYCLLSADVDWSIEVVMAKAAVGSGEELSSIAKRSQAVAAISGSYFQNYDSSKPKDPYGLLISRGRVLHNDAGSCEALVFTTDGKHTVTTLKTSAVISSGGHEFKVSALNHTPTQNKSSITIFDQNRGTNVGFNYGTNYIVQNGIVTKIQTNINSAIPSNGYVINVIDDNATLRKALKVNSAVKYSFVLDNAEIKDIQAALKIDMLLVQNGNNQLGDASALSKSDNTSLSRSAVGFTKKGDIILLAGVRATMPQLAEIMLKAGAEQAVAINGGASSGLIVDNDYLAEPLCDLSNALVFKEK